MKHLNLNLNKTLSPNSNIVLSSQQAIKSYVDSKKVFVQFLQESAPTTFKAGDKWVNTASNKLFIATNDTTWDNGSNLDTAAIYSFGNLLYHYNGTDTKCYSTTSITEQNTNKEIKEWFGTQDEYNAIETKDENTHYIIIDDTSTSSSLLATQEEFNNSVTDKAATPKQVNEKIGNYLPLAGGNLDGGAILRFTNTNNQVSSMSLDENKYITMSDNLKVSGDINTNSLVSTTGNIYKGNSGGATNIWSDSFATAEKAGIIKVGNNLTIAEDGTLNAEAGSGSGFDFEGTKAEFDAAVAAGTITDDSVSLITDDVSGDTVATKTELDMISSKKANIDLSNTDMLTNCILSAPNGVFKTPNWKEFWNGSDVTSATDRSNVKLSVNGAYTKDKVSLTDANGNWSYVAKFKITKNNAGSTVTARGRILYFGFKNADASQSAYTEIQLSNSSGASELKPFFVRIRPKFGDTTTTYTIRSTQKPVVDAWNWIKLQKNGIVYTMFYSTDGNSWTSLGQVQAENFSGVPKEISGGFRITKPTGGNLNMYADFNTNTLNFFYNSLTSTPLVTYDEYTLIVNNGLKVALANGYNADGTPKSEIVTLENDVSITIPSTTNYNWPIYVILAKPISNGAFRIMVPSKSDFASVKVIPSNIPTDFYKIYYCTDANTFYEHSIDGSLSEYKGVLLGFGKFVDSKFTDMVPYKPIQLSLEGLGDYVVESLVNADGSWYRKYKSGWLEQGGQTPTVAGGATTTVTLLKPYNNAVYNVVVQPVGAYSPAGEANNVIPTRTTTNFIIACGQIAAQAFSWRAEGQGAE